MPEFARNNRRFGSYRETGKHYNIAEKQLRRAVKRRELAAYLIGDSGWEKLFWPEVEEWARRRRVPATHPSNHTEVRLAEVLERERRAGL